MSLITHDSQGRIVFTMVVFFNIFLSTYSYGYPNDITINPELEPFDIDPPRPGWVDPFDMLGETKYSSDSLIVQSDVYNHGLKKRLAKCEEYMRLFVNMFLHASELSRNSDPNEPINMVNLQFLIDGKDLALLQKFGQHSDGSKIEDINNIFNKIFSQKSHRYKQQSTIDMLLGRLDKVVSKLIMSPEWTVIISVSVMFLSTLWLVYNTHSYRLAIFTLFLTLSFASFGFTWIRLYEEKEVEKYLNIELHGLVPYHCSGKPMAWYEHMYHRMFSPDCLEFFKIRDIRPIIKVSPQEVFVEMVSSMIVKPATYIGAAYGNFIITVVDKLPWWLKPIAVPLSFIIPPIFILFVLVLLFNYRISISIWSGFQLSPCWFSSHLPVQHSQNNDYIEDLSHKENENIKKNSTFEAGLASSETPLFFMNLPGLKKLISSSVLPESDNINNVTEDQDQSQDQDAGKEDIESAQEIMNLEELLKTVEKRKASGSTKQRSKITCTCGVEEKNIEEDILASGDNNRTIVVYEKDKDKLN